MVALFALGCLVVAVGYIVVVMKVMNAGITVVENLVKDASPAKKPDTQKKLTIVK